MATYQPGPYRQRVDWQQVLQEPYLTIDDDVAARKRDQWMLRQGTMNAAQSTGLAALNAALQAERDKKLADLRAADELARRGGGSGGGGGKAAAQLLPSVPAPVSSWYDQLASMYDTTPEPPPTYNGELMPSTLYGPENVWTIGPEQNRTLQTRASRQGWYDKQQPKPPAVGTTSRAYANKPKKPSKTKVVLS